MAILEHLSAIMQDDSSLKETKYFYNLCYQIALTTIQFKYSGEKLIFSSSDLTYDNIATDAIAPLFVKRSVNEPIGLVKSLINWKIPIQKESDADFFIHKVVWNRVAQFMTKLLKRSDPFFDRILRSVKYYVDKNNYNRITYFGSIYITEPEEFAITDSVIGNDELNNIPHYLFYGNYGEVFLTVIDYIKKYTDYFPAVPLNTLVKKIKQVNGNEFQRDSFKTEDPCYEQKLDIDRIINACLNKVYCELDKIKFKNSKKGRAIKTAYKQALKDISSDLKNGYGQRGLYHYFKLYLNDLKKDDFYKNYYYLMNLLLDQLRNFIKEEINFQKF